MKIQTILTDYTGDAATPTAIAEALEYGVTVTALTDGKVRYDSADRADLIGYLTYYAGYDVAEVDLPFIADDEALPVEHHDDYGFSYLLLGVFAGHREVQITIAHDHGTVNWSAFGPQSPDDAEAYGRALIQAARVARELEAARVEA